MPYTSRHSMKAIILAAGRGSRMKSLTDDRPKCLIEFRGKPLLQLQLDALRGAGFTAIAIVCGYRGELLTPYGLKMFDNPRWAQTNMVSSLECAAEWLAQEECVVSYSDIFYSSIAVDNLRASSAELAVAYAPDWLDLWKKRFADPLDDAETFRLDFATGRILEIGKKPRTVDEIQGQYMGLLKFTPASWMACSALRAGLESTARDRMDMTSMLQSLIESGFPVTGVPVNSDWGELDSDDDLVNLS